MRILFFGTYDSRLYPRVRVLREGLAEAGHDVVERNIPLAADARLRLKLLQKPWLAPVLAAGIASAWRHLWRASRRLPPVDAVVVGYMGHFDVHLARRLWPDTAIVLDHLIAAHETALDRHVSSLPLLRLFAAVDRRALRAADIVCVDTDEHRDSLPAAQRTDAVVVPVGAADEWFSPPARHDVNEVRVVFYGSYTPLQGAPVIGEAIARLVAEQTPLRFTMLGRGQDLERTRAAAGDRAARSVEWIEWVEPEDLPGFVSSFDVCLGIFGTSEKALRVVPNKVFQGAAAGCAIVTSDTPPQRRALDDAAIFVPPGDAAGLADMLRSLAEDRHRLFELREAAYERADRSFRPAAVVAPLENRLRARIPG